MIMHFQRTNVTVNKFFFKEDYTDGSPLREINTREAHLMEKFSL